MTIAIASPLTEAEFNQRLTDLLVQLEDKRRDPYADTANSSHPTIGIGFDLTVTAVRNQVFAAMGIVAGSALATSLTNAINGAVGKTTSQIQADLNQAYGGTFQMTDAQINAAFPQIAKRYIDIAKGSEIAYSNELVALTSVAFNGLYGPGLARALTLADPYEARAEAWYEIRYEHGPQLYKRRYAEAALFGLYGDGNLTEEMARGLYRMYTRHTLENPGSSVNMANYDTLHGSWIAGANADLAAAGFTAQADTLEHSLQPAASFLINQYGEGRTFSALNIWVSNISGSHLQSTGDKAELFIGYNGNDLIQAGGGNDVLNGGSGTDYLYGEAGDDILVGGEGEDILSGGAW